MAAWECVQVVGIDGTKLTSYGATVTNYGDYHDITLYRDSQYRYSDIISRMGSNYFFYHDENTCEPGESAVWVEVYNDGKFSMRNMSTRPYYDYTDSKNRKHYSYRYGLDLFYQGSLVGRLSATGSSISPAGTTPSHVNFPDHLGFGFLIDRTRSLGQLLIYEHEDGDDAYYWHQRTQGGIDNWHYNVFTGNMLNYQAINYITGNNKTYNLSKILSINGGEPISGGSASTVNLLTESRLDNIIASN